MHPVQSIGYAAAYPAYPLNPPLVLCVDVQEIEKLTSAVEDQKRKEEKVAGNCFLI